MAKYLVWLEQYSVGHEEIDTQHKRILEIINSVYTLVKHHQAGDELIRMLQAPYRYTIDHFDLEEND